MNNNGFSIVEIVLALAIVLIAVSVFIGGLLYGSDSLVSRHTRIQARLSAQECLYVARWLRDSGGLDELPEGIHGLTVSSGNWALSGSSDGIGSLTRTMTIADVDEYSKEVTCSVSWESQFGQRQVVLETRISEWIE